MKILLLGSQGQLGATLAEVLADEHDLTTRSRTQLDVTDQGKVWSYVTTEKPDVIVNCAAFNDVDGAESEPQEALAVNAFAVQSLAAVATEVCARLIHYSSDFVFDGEAASPYAEGNEPNPQGVYATSKLLGEWFAAETPMHYVIRVESLFGGRVSDREEVARRGSSLDRLADDMLNDHAVRAFVDRVVSPSYVVDVANATLRLIDVNPAFGIYHCVGSGHATWFAIVKELGKQLGLSPIVDPLTLADINLAARRPKYSALSNTKLADVGIDMPTWEDAINRYARRLLLKSS